MRFRKILQFTYCCSIIAASLAYGQTTYYVSTSGSDAYNGTSTSTPWQTLNKVSRSNFNAGDKILLKCGDIFYTSQINMTGLNGTASNPIIIASYGTGAKPILVGDLHDVTWTSVAGYTGIYKTFCGFNDQLWAGYENVNGAWTEMTQAYTEDRFFLNTPANRTSYLNSFTASTYGPGAASNGFDTIFVKTWDGNAPNVRIFKMNILVNSSYVTIRDLDFQRWKTAFDCEYSNNIQYTQLNSLQSRYVSFMTYKSPYCLVDSCRADSAGYTAFYNTEGHRNIYRYNTANSTSHIVLNIKSGSECCGMGFQQDTSCIAEYNVMTNCADAGFDTYFNVTDTIRNCTLTGNNQGLYLNGAGWVCYNNTISSIGVYSIGIQTTLCGSTAMVTSAYNNTIMATGSGLQPYSNVNGGTVTFYNNNVSCTSQKTPADFRFSDFQATSGLTSVNNNFYGVGVYNAGQWPNENIYTSLTAFQKTGYENGSNWSSGPGAPTGTFTDKPDTLPLGGGVDTLKWTSQYADSAKIDNGIGRVATNGSMTVTVTATTVFKLTLIGKSGSTTYIDSVIVRKPLSPTGTFTATSDTLPIGGGVDTLKWTSLNANSAQIDNGIGTVTLSGFKPITVTTTTVFKLSLVGSSGSTVIYSKTVTVKKLLPTGTFTAAPDTLPIGGGIDTLKWTSQNADSAKIDNGIGPVSIAGSKNVSVTATTVFKLTLIGKSGSTTYVDSVIVRKPPSPTGTFTATVDTLPIGGGVDTLKWTSLNANSAQIDNGIGTVVLSGFKPVIVTTSTVFILTLTGPSGLTTNYAKVVIVRTLVPVGTFSASPDTILRNGGKVTFKWTSQNATSAIIDNGIGTVLLNGSISKWVYNTTAFTLTLSGPNGSTSYIDSVIALVPPTAVFTILPDTLPIGGGVVTLQWTSLNATSCKIDNNVGNVPPNGSCTVSVPMNTVFNFTATGPSGTITCVDTVVVLQQPKGTLTITPDTLPTIPGTVTLNWTSENATVIVINPLIGKLDSPCGSKTITVTSNTVFELTLYGPSGLIATYADSVIVLKPTAGVKSIGAPPRDYSLGQNYPNPFNSSTRIEYELPRAGFTTLKIYNSLGVLITSLVSNYLQPGKYIIEWDASKFASGLYFYRLQTGTFKATRKLILLR